jgi:small GTP-binding protein
MPKIPTSLKDIRTFLLAIDWLKWEEEIRQEMRARVAIVGPVNSGKSTLFNLLYGRAVSPVSAVPGTTRTLLQEEIGPFVVIDTPGFGEVDGVDSADIAQQGLAGADVAVLVLDAAAGVRQGDYELYRQLLATGKPVLLTLNKIDLIGSDLLRVLDDLTNKLGIRPIPISAKTGQNVATVLVPRLIDAQPNLAVAIGRALPAYRRQAANGAIRVAVAWAGAIGAEPIPGVDIPLLIANQVRLVLRLAAIYGEPISVENARELVATIVSGVALRYLAEEAAKALPGPGWIISGSIAAAGTWAMGRVAVEYFESGKQLSPLQMRQLYQRLASRGQGVGRQVNKEGVDKGR